MSVPDDPKIDRILGAAFGLFCQHGFRKVTMSDIADAAEMSRPTLYAVFPNKESVFGGLAIRQITRSEAEVTRRMPKAKTLEARLGVLFDVVIVEPFAEVVDRPSGLDMLGNASVYAPKECGAIYERFEAQLTAVLDEETSERKPAKKRLTAKDLAHIMTLATRGLKATTQSLAELRRLTDGLIAMAVATVRS